MAKQLQISILLAIFALMLSGCGGGGGSSADTAPPSISGGVVELPEGWRFTGGMVRVSVNVTDPSGVVLVQAHVTDGQKVVDLSQDPIILNLRSGSTSVYEGSFIAPANTDPSGLPKTYYVEVSALGAKGNETSGTVPAASFQVPGVQVPPPPPDL